MGKFILIDLKKRGEHSELKKLGPTLLNKMDVWIAEYQDGTPTAEECTTVENAKIQELMDEYDVESEKLGRVKEEVPEARAQFVKYLNWKRGKLFLKFGATIQALEEQAVTTLQHCQEMWETFQESLKTSFPVEPSVIGQELQEFLSQTTQYIEDTFPEGVKGLDQFDDALPNGTPSYTEFQRSVMASEHKLKEANTAAIPDELAKLQESSKEGFKLAVNEAIQKAIADIVLDLQQEETLPYLDEEEMEAFRKELIKAAEEYGASRME